MQVSAYGVRSEGFGPTGVAFVGEGIEVCEYQETRSRCESVFVTSESSE